ncbi:HET-domain-containing protein [Xylaria longipes]|nr:HET-domain-containing protein [Xylaria longipes]
MQRLYETSRRHGSSQAGEDNALHLYRRQLNDRDYEVRLLELYQYSSSGSSHAFKCRLQYLSLKESPQYVALSVQVSETLLSALEQLWQMGNTLIRVDYLCINQGDSDEKSGQVRMMDIIFSKAATVFSWLGTGGYDSDMAMGLPEEIEIACDAVIRLLSRPYWTRCWVNQEICRARSPVVVCGGRSVPWNTMLKRLDGLGSSVPAQYAQHLLSPLRQMRYREQNRLRAGSEISLVPLLVLSRKFLAHDPRDKLYALLSLAKDGRTLIPTPDYSQTAEHDHDRTDVILLAHRTRGRRNLPSWAPDWANMHSQPPPWILECLNQRPPGRMIRNKVHENTLEVQGFQYDTFNERGLVAITHPSITESVAVNLCMGLGIDFGAELDQITIIRALLRMCNANDSRITRRPSRLQNWVAHNANRLIGGNTLARCLEIYLGFRIGSNNHGSSSTDITDHDRTQLAIERGFESLERLRMVFAVTRCRPLRIVHRDAKRGDDIYILQNCPLPVVLRR